jgi:hypothetical protein
MERHPHRGACALDDVAVAVVADQTRGSIGVNRQLPDLEFFGSNVFLETLRDRGGIEKPIGSAFTSDLFGAVRKQDAAVDAVPVPVFGTGEAEVDEIGLCEFGRFRHGVRLSFEVTPSAGAGEAQGWRNRAGLS